MSPSIDQPTRRASNNSDSISGYLDEAQSNQCCHYPIQCIGLLDTAGNPLRWLWKLFRRHGAPGGRIKEVSCLWNWWLLMTLQPSIGQGYTYLSVKRAKNLRIRNSLLLHIYYQEKHTKNACDLQNHLARSCVEAEKLWIHANRPARPK